MYSIMYKDLCLVANVYRCVGHNMWCVWMSSAGYTSVSFCAKQSYLVTDLSAIEIASDLSYVLAFRVLYVHGLADRVRVIRDIHLSLLL